MTNVLNGLNATFSIEPIVQVLMVLPQIEQVLMVLPQIEQIFNVEYYKAQFWDLYCLLPI